MRGFNRLEEPGGGAGLRRTGAGGAGFSDRVGVGGREVPLMTPMGDGNTADTNICQIHLDKHPSGAAKASILAFFLAYRTLCSRILELFDFNLSSLLNTMLPDP